MKKVLLYLALCVCALSIVACGSTPPRPPGSGSNSEPITTQEQADEAFEQIYNEYHDDLILTGAKSYTVVKGDKLADISRREYANGFYFPLIMLASRDLVLDPDKIEPGMTLTIPNLQANLNDANARAYLKKFLVEIAGIYDRRPRRAKDADGLRDLASSL